MIISFTSRIYCIVSKVLTISLLCLSRLPLFAQTQQPGASFQMPKVIPPAPNAAAMAKYGDIPVNTYTGIPSISIPLFELQAKGTTVPISLSYQAGGIRVEENASWVGLGWSLNAGGVVTRSIRGLADEETQGGYLYNSINLDSIERMQNSGFASNFAGVLADVREGRLDLEPDAYFFNFNGRAGKFIIDRNTKKAFAIPYQKIDIRFDRSSSGPFERWTIRTEDGTTYVFGKTTDNLREAVETTNNLTRPSRSVMTAVSSWYLVEIITTVGEKVSFKYKSSIQSYLGKGSETLSRCAAFNGCSDDAGNTVSREIGYNETQINCQVLSSVESNSGGRIEFETKTENRRDLGRNSRALEFVKIYNSVNTLVKQYRLHTDYFESVGTLNVSYPGGEESRKLRLMLKSVTEMAPDGSAKNPHVFDYHYDLGSGLALPEKMSDSQDHWGYYNGASNAGSVPVQAYPMTCTNDRFF